MTDLPSRVPKHRAIILALGSQRKENFRFKDRLGFVARFHLKGKGKTTNKQTKMD